MKSLLIIVYILAQSLTTAQANEAPIRMTYLGTNHYQISHAENVSDYQIEIFNLDELNNLEKEITSNLPSDPIQAERLVNARMQDLDNEKAMRMFKSVALLIEWDVKKLPAFVFGEGEYVIYGVTDTAIAIQRFVNSRKR
jgi:integrating conjugative element protein (TIGR03757 family)